MARKHRSRWRRVKSQEELREEKAQKKERLLRRRERFGRGVADLFEIPEDIVLNVPRITIVGNLQMIIENHRGILEYSPQVIRVATGNGRLEITGEDLAVGSVFAEDLSVMGRFSRITFEEAPSEGEGDQAKARRRPLRTRRHPGEEKKR